MAVELAEVAAGLPMAASLALAGGISSLREGRRRTALNEAMHELRRPLQVLSLALPDASRPSAQVDSSLELATVALERLDREINGVALEKVVTEVSVDALVDDAMRRWQGLAGDIGRSLKREWNEPETYVLADRFDLAQALDNLLSNAFEHGSGEVRIGWSREGSRVSISVSNSVTRTLAKVSRRRPRHGRSRRGHGLRVVDRVARGHGGRFDLRFVRDEAKATMRLPLLRRNTG